MRGIACGLLLAFMPCLLAQDTGLPPGVKNTQDPKDVPPSPAEAVRRFKPDKGFNVSLFAGEPDVAQPISMAFDERGRLWVAECFSSPNWTKKPAEGRDRILIFEDTDGDGKFDRRTVFWNRAYNLTSVLPGNGGVWALCAPHLLFIPDRDGKRGEPQIVLDGWSLDARHNIVNGLLWGPDGWIYGRHGIVAESRAGSPGTPKEKRPPINCGVWRYHPTKKKYEVVAHGTTNPWGMDFDEHGEAFITNCVIGHLWHVVPGARYQRMYGQDYNKYSYELMPSTSDHLHWGGGHWTDSRSGKGSHSEAGGGHAHVGAMIYLGDNLPDRFRNHLFTCNIHGNRINCDTLQRHGNGYVARHTPDFLLSDNQWFRGIDLTYGPDGGVFVADWCDFGECHDNDGTHKSSGRIYKVTHGKPKPVIGINLAKESDEKLVELQFHANEWYVRQARRILTERAAAGRDMLRVHARLRNSFDDSEGEPPQKLRAMWALYVTGGAKRDWLTKQLRHTDEHVRSWAVRLLCDDGPLDEKTARSLTSIMGIEQSRLVRLHLASALRHIRDPRDRHVYAVFLARHAEDADDPWQSLMIWYAIEPTVTDPTVKPLLAAKIIRIPKVRQFIVRRLTEHAGKDVARLEPIFELATTEENAAVQRDYLAGVRDGLRGLRDVKMPSGWKTAFPRLATSKSEEVQLAAHQLGLMFRDPRASDGLRAMVRNKAGARSQREGALHALVEARDDDMLSLLYDMLPDASLRGPALRALAGHADEKIPQSVLNLYPSLTAEHKQDALATLASRKPFALALLDAVEKKRIPRTDISPFTARQMRDLKDKDVAERLEKVWGQVRQSSADKKALIAKHKALLTPDVLKKANAAAGRLVYKKTCAQCHTLFGEGNKIGPDLTGSNRADLHYVLENIIDPSALIGRDYQLTNIVTKNGRLIAGIIVEENDRALTMQTANEKLVISKADVDERQVLPISMMPEGQIEQLTFAELRDLVAYLASKEQVPLKP